MTVIDLPVRPPADHRQPLYCTDYTGLDRTIAVLNNKGGVGKTALTLGAAMGLARRGRRVLLVDMDPQGNLTRRAGVHADDITAAGTIGDVLARNTRGSAGQAIVPCGWESPEAHLIDVLPADIELAARDEEAATPGAERRLARVLYGVTDRYDYVLVDCRPTLQHLEQMVVFAASGPDDGYLIPVEPGADAIGGATRVVSVVATWADQMDVDVTALGAVVNLYDGRTKLHRGRAAGLAGSLALVSTPDGVPQPAPPPVLGDPIPRNAHLSEVFDLGQPITAADRRLVAEGMVSRFDALAALVDSAVAA